MSETTVVEVGADQFRLLPNGLWIDCYDNGIVESTPFAAVLTALAAARREGEAVTQRAIQAEADLATSRAALEDVRRVEKWLAKDFQLGRYVKTTGSGKLVAIEEDPDMAVVAISLEALGRALAQEAGDGG